jgi:uncharacterized protein (TIGR00251 family)
MKMQKIPDGVVIVIFVKPNSKLFQLKAEGDELVVSCRESPIKGRANKELIKELSRIFKKRVEIIAGFTSKQKKVLIKDISTSEANAILSKHTSE